MSISLLFWLLSFVAYSTFGLALISFSSSLPSAWLRFTLHSYDKKKRHLVVTFVEALLFIDINLG